MRSPNEDIVNGIALALRMPLESLLESLDKKNTAKPVEERPNIVQLARESTPQVIPLYKQPYSHPDFIIEDGVLLEQSQYIECPPFLKEEEGSYAVEMPDTSMEPRYNRGDILFVNPNILPIREEDAIIQYKHKPEAGKSRWIALVREIVKIDDLWEQEYSPKQPDDAFVYFHTMKQKFERTYNGNFKEQMALDRIEEYASRAESLRAGKDDGCKVHLIVGVQKVRMTRHYTLKVEDTISMKADVGQVAIKVQ